MPRCVPTRRYAGRCEPQSPNPFRFVVAAPVRMHVSCVSKQRLHAGLRRNDGRQNFR